MPPQIVLVVLGWQIIELNPFWLGIYENRQQSN